jgi:hypothetical protein
VVLTDPHNALFGLLTPREMIAAMMGDLVIRVPRLGTGATSGRARLLGRSQEWRAA